MLPEVGLDGGGRTRRKSKKALRVSKKRKTRQYRKSTHKRKTRSSKK